MTEICIHVANIFYLASFLGRDMLWLRVLTCGGLALGIVFFTCQPAPMYGPTFWHVAFLAINGVQITRLVVERRRLTLPPEQERLSEETFDHMNREQLLDLLSHVTYAPPTSGEQVQEVTERPLSEEEAALRDIAFSRLSRKELLNLLTRRMWHCIKWLNITRWRYQARHSPERVGDADPERKRS